MAETYLALIRRQAGALDPANKVAVKISPVYPFEVECQGGVKVEFNLLSVDYPRVVSDKRIRADRTDKNMDTFVFIPSGETLPNYAVLLDNTKLGRAAHPLIDDGDSQRAATEMLDIKCVEAGCDNGSNCIWKRGG